MRILNYFCYIFCCWCNLYCIHFCFTWCIIIFNDWGIYCFPICYTPFSFSYYSCDFISHICSCDSYCLFNSICNFFCLIRCIYILDSTCNCFTFNYIFYSLRILNYFCHIFCCWCKLYRIHFCFIWGVIVFNTWRFYCFPVCFTPFSFSDYSCDFVSHICSCDGRFLCNSICNFFCLVRCIYILNCTCSCVFFNYIFCSLRILDYFCYISCCWCNLYCIHFCFTWCIIVFNCW